jgi:hypothetical protein
MWSLAVTLWKRRLGPYVTKNDTTEDSGLQPFTEESAKLNIFSQSYGTDDKIMSLRGICPRTRKKKLKFAKSCSLILDIRATR